MPKRLLNMIVRSVAAVDSPANRRKFLLLKSADLGKAEWTTAYVNDLPDSSFAVISSGGKKDDDGKTVPRSLRHLPYKDKDGTVDLPHLRNALARLNQTDLSADEKAKARAKLQAAAKEHDVGTAAKAEHAMTFDDAMFGRRIHKVYVAIGERYGALMETIDSIRQSADENKAAQTKAGLQAFVASLQDALPSIVAELESEESVEKTGRKISAERMAKLKTLLKTLEGIIAEGEKEEPAMSKEQQKPDAGTLTKLSNAIAALFGRAVGADEATLAALEKAAKGEPDAAEVMSLAIAKLEKAEASNAALAARLEKAEQETVKLREEAELRKFAEEVSGFKDIGLDPTKDAALLKAVSDKLPKEQADRIREIFRAQVAQAQASALFKEVGSAGAGFAAGSAEERIQQRVTELMSKSDKLTLEQARDRVFREDPTLYERWRDETSVKI